MKHILNDGEGFVLERKNGTEIVDLTNISSDGVSKDYVDTAISSKQDVIDDLSTIRSGAQAGSTAYQKPSGGIPKTDLASTVQTSLGKADTALQSYTETDPTVPSWAKSASKPTYTAQEVGALPSTTSIPTKTSELTNDSNFVVDADYVHTDSNYTAAEKSKLSGISAGAEENVQSDWSVTATTSDAFIKNKPSIPTESTVSGWGFTKNTGTITGINMNGASKGTSGVVNLGTVLTEHQSLSGCVTSANYDSTAKKIYLKNGSNVISEIDATDFIKDGMVSSASVSGSNLVIVFNTDAGHENISIPIADIFNASNYYTKDDIDGKNFLTGYTETDPVFTASVAHGISSSDISNWNGKTNNTAFTAHTASTSVHVSASEKNTWNGKQDALANASVLSAITSQNVSNWNSAEQNVQSDWSVTATTSDAFIKNKPTIPSKTSDLTNDSDFVTATEIANLDKIPYITASTAASVTIEPYKMYDFGTLSTAMTVVFDTSKEINGYAQQYMFRVTAGQDCSITLPVGVNYLNNVEPVFTEGHVYEFDITNLMCVFGEFYNSLVGTF